MDKGRVSTHSRLRAVEGIVCITSQGADLNAEVDPRFGRAAYFVFIDPKTKETEIVENSYKDLMQGVGVQAAQLIANRKVSILLTGDCGPKAAQVLESANISIVTGVSGRVEDAVKKYYQR